MQNILVRTFIRDYENIKDPKVRTSYGYLGAVFGIVSNLLLFGIKIIVGMLMNSIAVIADAFNNLSDAGSSIVTLIGFHLSGKPADLEHPFGHGRMEYLSALVVAAMIMAVGFDFAVTSIEKILEPTAVTMTTPMLLILVVSVLIKLYQNRFNLSIGRKIDSQSLIATAKDSLNDVIITSVVIVSVVIGEFVPFPIDGYIGALVALFILKAGFDVMRDTIDPLLGMPATKEFADEITSIVMEFSEVVGTHDLIVHDYGPGRKIVTIHAEIPEECEFVKAHEVSDEIEKLLSKRLGVFATVHVDPVITKDERIVELSRVINEVLNNIDDELSFHDLRIVDGERNINVVLDVVLCGHNLKESSRDNIHLQIEARVKEIDSRYTVIVEYDMPHA